ncbi:MAG: ABC transporter ATP-binding protein [Chloroflexi bacterium]|nr:ABC transporter ATP-binding protein [Chloroflexota bacterium]
MRLCLRCLSEYRGLWPVGLPLLFLTALLPPIALTMPLVERYLVDGVVLAKRVDLLPQAVVLYGGIWLLTTTVQIVGALLRTYLIEQMMLRLKQRLFAHCERLSLAFAHREHSGRTIALFVNDVPNLVNLFSTTVLGAVGSVVTLLVGASIMFSLSWQLALVAGVAPPLVAGLAGVITRPMRPAARRAQEKAAELTERLQENLAGMREVVAFGQEQRQGRSFTTALRDLLRLRMRLTLMDIGLQTGQSLFSLTVTLAIVGYGGYLVIAGETTIGTLVAMRSLFAHLFQPASQLFGMMSGVQKALASAERIYGFLDEKPRVVERPRARALRQVRGEIVFDGVSFAYEPGRPVLHDVSFVARPGELLALVGPSGAGKSTLLSLVARFYDPTAGRLLLDGVDLRDLTIADLRDHIGIVFQDTFLFATTIGENIAFGREGADEARVVAAARAANAWEFIARLPQGLETPVGERGVQLSEGQKQRLAIARAVLRDPRMLILDEPTSALDARSEHLLQAALDNLMRGRTTFVSAHRLATVQRADRILVVEGGRVVEEGTHAALLRSRGLYRELFELQFGAAAALDGAQVSDEALAAAQQR